MDWKLASVLVMMLIGVYNIVARRFFKDGEDWRIAIPFLFAGSLVLFVYFLLTFREVRYTQQSLTYGLVLVGLAAVLIALSIAVFANPRSQLSVAVPIMSMGTLVTVLLSIALLGERLNAQIAAGIALGIVSVILLTWQTG